MAQEPDRFSDVVMRLRAAGCVFAEEEAELLLAEAQGAGNLETLVARRVAGEPLEVVLGWAMFHGLRVEVDKGVFVPRRRTEFLVDLAIAQVTAGHVVVDLCCGTGALGLAVATAVPGTELHGVDVDPVATACAARNLVRVGGVVHEGDLFDALPAALAGRVDVLLVNAPYVPTDEIALMPPEARDHEPRHTLDGGDDGVQVHRAVVADVARWLRPGGTVLIETGQAQAELTAAALTTAGLQTKVMTSQDVGATVVVGTRRPEGSSADPVGQ